MQPRIEYKGITKRFRQNGNGTDDAIVAVQDVTLSIKDGEVVSLIGPSGCGKSTLLNMGSGLYAPSEGEVLVDGDRVEGPNDHVAFMLQKDLLLPWRTIRQNVELGQEIKGTPSRQRRARALELLEKCRLAQFADHYPHQLSGGMRQRAALARTLAVNPTVLLMDEPFSALDAQTKMILQQDLAETLAREGKTALFITHDLAESVALSDRILVMSQRPGTIISEIVVDIPGRDNPMERRHQHKVSDYIGELMELLHVGEHVADPEI
jgi:NitT/TauT family transport system ATP-binding protein